MRTVNAAIAAGVVLLAALAALILRRGDLTSQLTFIGLLIAPFAVFAAITRPLIFPFCLYVLLVPFDNLLSIGAFGTLTKLLGMICGACVGLALLWQARTVPLSRASLMLIGAFAWMLLSVTWALDQEMALDALMPYLTIFAFYIALASMRPTSLEFAAVLTAIALGGVVAAAYGTNEFIHNPAITANATRFVMKSDSSNIDPNQFADSMLPPAALVAMWGLRSRNLLVKLIGVIGVSMLGVAILVSGSREALIALVVMFLYLIVRSRYRIQMLAVIAALAPLLATMPTTMWKRFGELASTGGAGRADIWKVGLEAGKHQPIQGYGIGNFRLAYDQFYLGIHQTYPYGFHGPAHNIILHYGVELGIMGFVFIVAWFVWHWRTVARIPKDHPLRDYATALEASLVAVAFASLTIDLFTYKWAWLVFSSIAMLSNLARGDARQPSAETRVATPAMIPARSSR